MEINNKNSKLSKDDAEHNNKWAATMTVQYSSAVIHTQSLSSNRQPEGALQKLTRKLWLRSSVSSHTAVTGTRARLANQKGYTRRLFELV